jgi:hypothetical protein
MQPPTPGDMADRLIGAMEPNTRMSVQNGTRVAGRDAYTLELVPRSDESLIAKVSIGVDAATGAPLEVVVDAVGQEAPAIAVGFTSFAAETPAADHFEFTAPEGANVREEQIPTPSLGHKSDARDGTAKPGISKPGNHPEAVDGQGWDTVVVVPAKEVPKDLTANELLNQLATPVDGGKLLHTSLFNVLLTEDGRMVMGAVTVDRLQAAANGK